MRKFLAYKTRSVWKGYNFIPLKEENCSRNYIVKLRDEGKVVKIYNGYTNFIFTCIKRYVGYKLGQFILTKKIGRSIHGVLNSNRSKKGSNKKAKKINLNIKSKNIKSKNLMKKVSNKKNFNKKKFKK